MAAGNPYGRFSEDGREYIVTTPLTPEPWRNCLGNARFGSVITQTGSGFHFLNGPENFLVTAGSWRPRTGGIGGGDPNGIGGIGRGLYLRDDDSKEIWTLGGYQPGQPGSYWEARHGLGYTAITHTRHHIRLDATFFVPIHDPVEVWMIRLRNESRRFRSLSVFTAVEWVLCEASAPDARQDLSPLFNHSWFADDILWAATARTTEQAFLAASRPVVSFETDRARFLGRSGSTHRPEAVERGYCSNWVGRGREALGALHHQIIMPPGDETSLVVLLGVEPQDRNLAAVRRRLLSWEGATAEFERLSAAWRGAMDPLHITTPDPDVDRGVNWWLKYQALTQLRWQPSAVPADRADAGLRDHCQHLLTLIPLDSDLARIRIREVAERQRQDGNPALADPPPADLPIWLPVLLSEWVRETGEAGILEETAAYNGGGAGTLYQHGCRGLDAVLSRLGSRGLVLLVGGDELTTLNQAGRQGRGESVWATALLVYALKRWLPFVDAKGQAARNRRYLDAIADLTTALNTHGWDGHWFLRAITDAGDPLGSHAAKEPGIDLAVQAWVTLAGAADPPDRAQESLNSAARLLDTPYGPCRFSRAFTTPDPNIGVITCVAPGKGENGAIAARSAAWRAMAECIIGRPDQAYEILSLISPLTQSNHDPDLFRLEPFARCGWAAGPDAPEYGEGGDSWAPAVAPWILKAVVEGLLGVRPELRGLKVNPCLPRHWPLVRILRRFRGATYDITIHNPEGRTRGVSGVLVDGARIEGTILPIFGDGKIHLVEVALGDSVPLESSAAPAAAPRA